MCAIINIMLQKMGNRNTKFNYLKGHKYHLTKIIEMNILQLNNKNLERVNRFIDKIIYNQKRGVK